MAIRAGIRWDYSATRSGNPYYCLHCTTYFNHGATSLERHLRRQHTNPVSVPASSVPAPSGPETERPSTCQTKPEDAKVDTDFTEPILHVSSCGTAIVSKIIQGQYSAKRWNHSKPVYEKEEVSFGCPSVLIYFWDNRDGERLHGWWFAPKMGGDQVWAFNPSNLGPDDLTVPKSGWKVPWDGHVDWILNITTPRATKEPANGKETDFELRWEFDASTFHSRADGEKEDWQPMSKEMNDTLENRWTKGWHGDDGTDVFHTKSGGFTYAVDCYCMVQWNVKTLRRRYIRRGEARPNVNALLAQLAEKDAQVERLHTEKVSLVEERTELIAKVAKLEILGGTKAESLLIHVG